MQPLKFTVPYSGKAQTFKNKIKLAIWIYISKGCRVNPVIFTTEHHPLEFYFQKFQPEYSKFPKNNPFKNFSLYGIGIGRWSLLSFGHVII